MCQIVDDCVEEMVTLVTDELDWAPEPAAYVLVKEFDCQGRGIVSERFGLYPLCTVVGGDEDVLVACVCRAVVV